MLFNEINILSWGAAWRCEYCGSYADHMKYLTHKPDCPNSKPKDDDALIVMFQPIKHGTPFVSFHCKKCWAWSYNKGGIKHKSNCPGPERTAEKKEIEKL
jgi:hypothetical protein